MPISSPLTDSHFQPGIALLKIWMTFEVVFFHCMSPWLTPTEGFGGIICSFFLYFTNCTVQVFMLFAFMLSDFSLLGQNQKKRLLRYERLLIPNLFWAVFYFLFLFLFDLRTGSSNLHGPADLLWQLLFGHCYNRSLWYQFSLIVLTFLFVSVFHFVRHRTALLITVFLSFGFLFIQYSGLHVKLLTSISWPQTLLSSEFDGETYIASPIGRCVEMLPCAAAGILIRSFQIFERTRKNRVVFLSLSFVSILFLYLFRVFRKPDGFGFQGIEYVILAFLLISVFMHLPFERLPAFILLLIRFFSRYMMGIYFVHRLVAYVYYFFTRGAWSVIDTAMGTLSDCVIIFMLSFLLVFLFSRIPVKWIRMTMQ